MTETELPHYRLLQLGAPNRNGVQGNEPFETLDDLVTHHPGANRNARLVDGVPQQVENPRRRSYGVVGGEIQEIEVARTDEYRVLTGSQVLLVKDFILEDSRLVSGAAGVREVDVPAPLAGYIGRVDAANGVVDILDRQGGEVIASHTASRWEPRTGKDFPPTRASMSTSKSIRATTSNTRTTLRTSPVAVSPLMRVVGLKALKRERWWTMVSFASASRPRRCVAFSES